MNNLPIRNRESGRLIGYLDLDKPLTDEVKPLVHAEVEKRYSQPISIEWDKD